MTQKRASEEVERVMGIEPTLVAWEATVLPLNYTRWPPLILCRSRRVGKSTIQPARQSSGPRLRRRRSDAPHETHGHGLVFRADAHDNVLPAEARLEALAMPCASTHAIVIHHQFLVQSLWQHVPQPNQR